MIGIKYTSTLPLWPSSLCKLSSYKNALCDMCMKIYPNISGWKKCFSRSFFRKILNYLWSLDSCSLDVGYVERFAIVIRSPMSFYIGIGRLKDCIGRHLPSFVMSDSIAKMLGLKSRDRFGLADFADILLLTSAQTGSVLLIRTCPDWIWELFAFYPPNLLRSNINRDKF